MLKIVFLVLGLLGLIHILKLKGKLFFKDIVAVLLGRKFAFWRKRGFNKDAEQWKKSLSSDTLRFCKLKRISDLTY